MYVTTPAFIPADASRQIEVLSGDKKLIVGDLDQLAGFVHIASPAQALEFVRLRTSPATWLHWPRSRYAFVEITDQDHPWRDEYGATIDVFTKGTIEENRSGGFGILSREAFKIGKFSHPLVVREGKSYIIERWVLAGTEYTAAGPKYTVFKIRETVTLSGQYTRRSTLKLNAPTLPDTRWRLPTYD